MKKAYKIEIDCALCANKVQSAIEKVEGVNSVTVNFMTQKMIIDINDDIFDETLKKAIKAGKKVESDFEVFVK